MKQYYFIGDGWKKDFGYAYSLVAKSFNEFVDEGTHVSNSYNELTGAYDYVSIVNKEICTDGAKVFMRCSFDSFGAPLITVANSMWHDEDGHLRYGDHYEVVIYEGGCNIWYVSKASEGSVKPYLVEGCGNFQFPIEAKREISLSVEIANKVLLINVDGKHFEASAPKLKDSFHVGFTACEGLNRLYEASIEN